VGLVQKCPQEKRPSQLTPQRKKNVTNQYRNNNQCIKCNHLVEMAYFLGSCSEGILDQPIYTQTEYSNTFCLALPLTNFWKSRFLNIIATPTLWERLDYHLYSVMMTTFCFPTPLIHLQQDKEPTVKKLASFTQQLQFATLRSSCVSSFD
jgi:hypothetical protein